MGSAFLHRLRSLRSDLRWSVFLALTLKMLTRARGFQRIRMVRYLDNKQQPSLYFCFILSSVMLLTVCNFLGKASDHRSEAKPPSEGNTPASTAQSEEAQLALREDKIQVQIKSLPPPFASDSASQQPQIIQRPLGSDLQVPEGFQVNVFAQGLSRPRWLTVAPNGDVLLAESYEHRIRLLRDSDGDGQAETNTLFANQLNQPLGMAISADGQFFYVANTDAVVCFPYVSGQTRIQGRSQQITELPGRGYRQHWTRNLIFSPDGQKLFVSVGSRSNVAPENLPRASIQVMNLDGSNRQTYAYGLRNPVGLGFHPTTDVLYTTVNERDGLGDDLVPDYLTSVKRGGFYGWPFSYLGSV